MNGGFIWKHRKPNFIRLNFLKVGTYWEVYQKVCGWEGFQSHLDLGIQARSHHSLHFCSPLNPTMTFILASKRQTSPPLIFPGLTSLLFLSFKGKGILLLLQTKHDGGSLSDLAWIMHSHVALQLWAGRCDPMIDSVWANALPVARRRVD